MNIGCRDCSKVASARHMVDARTGRAVVRCRLRWRFTGRTRDQDRFAAGRGACAGIEWGLRGTRIQYRVSTGVIQVIAGRPHCRWFHGFRCFLFFLFLCAFVGTITGMIVQGGAKRWRRYRRRAGCNWRRCTPRVIAIVTIRGSGRWQPHPGQFNFVQTNNVIVYVLIFFEIGLLWRVDVILDIILYSSYLSVNNPRLAGTGHRYTRELNSAYYTYLVHFDRHIVKHS